MMYTAKVMGWMTIIEANNKREALRIAKARAGRASLLSTDVNESHLTPSTKDDEAWYTSMSH